MLNTSAFGKNDIRGIFPDEVNEELFYYVGKAYVRYAVNNSGRCAKDLWICVARDARLHSETLANSVISGVISMGANVIDIGLAPTPMGYYSEFIKIDDNIKINGALIITASHNPSRYNGLKMTFGGASLTEDKIQEVKALTEVEFVERESSIRHGMVKKFDIITPYIEKTVRSFPSVDGNIKIVVDSANATGGIVGPKLYKELGCEVVELFSEPDGNFPNHHPNPSDEKTLETIKKKVVEEKADFGIAFDGDSDRIGVIDSQGRSVSGDKLLLIYALDLIDEFSPRGEVPKIVSEVKCSQVLYDTINERGGEAIMHKTGHGFIKAKMKETGAILAGEMSGHIFFKDRYYGFDDAIYAGCRLIEIVAKHKKCNPDFKIENLLKPFEGVFLSKEVRMECLNEFKQPVLKALEEKIQNNPDIFGSQIKEIITIDGLRIIFDDGFALIRQSNTEPVFTLRFEANTQEKCKHYENTLTGEVNNILSDTIKCAK